MASISVCLESRLSTKGIDREDIISPIEDIASDYGLVRLNAFAANGDNAVIMYHGGHVMLMVTFLPAPRAPYARIEVRGGSEDLRSKLKAVFSERFGPQLKTASELEDEEDE